jgi:hypothetical protein
LKKISIINQGFRNIEGNNNVELMNSSNINNEIIEEDSSSAVFHEQIINHNNQTVVKIFIKGINITV